MQRTRSRSREGFRKNRFLKNIDGLLDKFSFVTECDGKEVSINQLHINIEETKGRLLFTIYGNNGDINMGDAEYIFTDSPYITSEQIKEKNFNRNSNENAYHLNSIKIDDCYGGKGLGAILLYYSIEFIFYNTDAKQIELDDDSDYGTSKNPFLRQQSIYLKSGFIRKDSVIKSIKNGTPIPIPDLSVGQEHFLFASNVGNFDGWTTKRTQLYKNSVNRARKYSTQRSSGRFKGGYKKVIKRTMKRR
jgi:hypothetical protein